MPFCGWADVTGREATSPQRGLASWVNAHGLDVAHHVGAGHGTWVFALNRVSHYPTFNLVVDDATLVGHGGPSFDAPGLLDAVRRGSTVSPAALPATEFALAVWNGRAGELTLWRDHSGGRALFYATSREGWVAYASVPEPLLALSGVTDTIDEDALVAHLVLGVEPQPDATLYSSLRRVPSGHRVVFGSAGHRTERVWHLNGAPRRAPDDGVPVALRGLLDEAVRVRVRGAKRPATELSGGLDSSVVTSLAARATPSNAKLIVARVNRYTESGQLVDAEETALADQLVTALPDVDVVTIEEPKPDAPFFLADAESQRRPLPDYVFLLPGQDRVMRRLAEVGASTVLTGWGGDQMASYRSRDDVWSMIAERRGVTALRNLRQPPGLLRNTKRHVWGPWREERRSAPRFGEAERARLLEPFLGRRIEERVRAALHATDRRPPMRARRRQMLAEASLHRAMELFDWLGQHHGVVPAHPLLDRRVLEFCDTMPVEWVGAVGQPRRAIRAATADALTQDAVRRRKASTQAGDVNPDWRARHEAVIAAALNALSTQSSWLEDYVDVGLLAREFRYPDAANNSDAGLRVAQLSLNVLVTGRVSNEDR